MGFLTRASISAWESLRIEFQSLIGIGGFFNLNFKQTDDAKNGEFQSLIGIGGFFNRGCRRASPGVSASFNP